jgi:hypothetical protein
MDLALCCGDRARRLKVVAVSSAHLLGTDRPFLPLRSAQNP